MIDKKKIEQWFSAEAFPGRDLPEVCDIRTSAKNFAMTIISNTPPSADQSHSIRRVRDAVHAAVQSIVCERPKK